MGLLISCVGFGLLDRFLRICWLCLIVCICGWLSTGCFLVSEVLFRLCLGGFSLFVLGCGALLVVLWV